jgi:hypothetical protein
MSDTTLRDLVLKRLDADTQPEDEWSALVLAAGTQWLFARETMQGSDDVLFVDEAGQMSLANVVAISGAAKSLVLLGDPNQLPQVSQGTHPEGAGVSALEHVLAGAQTIPPDRGLFLESTWRLHPNICAFTSEVFYEGRLKPEPQNAKQRVGGLPPLSGSGLRHGPVTHQRNATRSSEEARQIARAVEALLGQPWTNDKGETRPLKLSDILVVAPYNAQVGEISRLLRDRFGEGARVGTVDKFQGQEAPSSSTMATSSPEDASAGWTSLLRETASTSPSPRPRPRRPTLQPGPPEGPLPHPGRDAPRQRPLPLRRAVSAGRLGGSGRGKPRSRARADPCLSSMPVIDAAAPGVPGP